jgi:hypothetical protein
VVGEHDLAAAAHGERSLLHVLDELAVARIGAREHQHPLGILARADDEGVDLAVADRVAQLLGIAQLLPEGLDLLLEGERVYGAAHVHTGS